MGLPGEDMMQRPAGTNALKVLVGSRRLVMAAGLGAVGHSALSASSVDGKRKKRKKRKKPDMPCPACPGGAVQLSNGTCAVSCLAPGPPIQGGCPCSYASAENTHVRTAAASCDYLQQACTSTTQCPRGTHCQWTECGGENPYRCNSVCAP